MDKQFWHLAIANILSNLMVPLAGIVDTAFLGHMSEINPLAGVAIANVIFNVLYWSFGFLRMGTAGLTAQAHGRGDHLTLQLVLFRNSAIALLFGGAIVALQVPIHNLGFSLLSAEPAVQASATAFYQARIWGTPAVLLNLVLLGHFLGRGQGQRVVILSLVVNGSNILLDYCFIRQLGWGSWGAGAATALSQILMLAVGLGFAVVDWAGRSPLSTFATLWEPSALCHLFRLNRDILIRTFAIVLSLALFTHWSATFGTTLLAANTLLLQVFTLNAYFVDGLAFAMESFAGQWYAKGDRDRLRALLWQGGGYSLLIGLTFALLFNLFSRSLFGLMTPHAVILQAVQVYVPWLFPTLGLGAIAFLLDGYFLGLTAGTILRNATVSAALIGFLPLGAIASLLHQPHLLWLALSGLMLARVLTLLHQVPATLSACQ